MACDECGDTGFIGDFLSCAEVCIHCDAYHRYINMTPAEWAQEAEQKRERLITALKSAGETIDSWPEWKQALVASRSEKQMEDGR